MPYDDGLCTERFNMQSRDDGTLVGHPSPDVLFTRIKGGFIFRGEQFWGRAARASNDSKEPDARFIFQELSSRLAPPRSFGLRLICRYGEIHGDASLGFHRL